MKTGILFPHQLFKKNELIDQCKTIYLVEEFLFFTQYNFHKQKLAFHRASMKQYESYLKSKDIVVKYVASPENISDVRKLIPHLADQKIKELVFIDPTDYWLEHRIKENCNANGIEVVMHESPLFINSRKEIIDALGEKKKLFQTDFYKKQRIQRNILMESNLSPMGGSWTYDADNRQKYPKDKTAPKTNFLPKNDSHSDACTYIEQHFPNNYGILSTTSRYPTNFEESETWLQTFLQERFYDFGKYEDAIVAKEEILHHSVLTPMMNVGLLTPDFIINQALNYAKENDIPINSLEGFVRQIVGWREFMRGVYELKGTEERTANYWKFKRKIPASFWDGTTGIEPIDTTIKKVLKTGYCHHIERLMVLGNFMLLCEFDPDEVYRWFMEMFIDAYDWVMVPNVYGMSQFADGGLMATKPYISGSNYVLKMSDYGKGKWQETWDGLFWRFMHTHREFFLKNPRLGMLVRTFDKFSAEKQQTHLDNAEKYLALLDE